MQILRWIVGMYQTNCYVIENDNGNCVLIDPGDYGEAMIRELEKRELTPTAILLTHGHMDHICAIPELQEKWESLPVYCHPADCQENGYGRISNLKNLRFVEDGQVIEAAGFSFKVIHTPGHSEGSVVYILEDVLFTGDTLFRQNIGRTDLPGGNSRKIMESLKKLAALRGDYDVYPGHGEASTLEYERQYNYYMR